MAAPSVKLAKRVRAVFPDTGIYPPGTTSRPEKMHRAVEELLVSKALDYGTQVRVGLLDPAENHLPSDQFDTEATSVTGFHVHVYFDPTKEESVREAMAMRNEAIKSFPNITVNKAYREAVGPHPEAMWELELHSPAQFTQFMPWLIAKHGNLAALVHPNLRPAGMKDRKQLMLEAYKSHTDSGFWLGKAEAIARISKGVEKRIQKLVDNPNDPLMPPELLKGMQGLAGAPKPKL